MGLPRSVTRLLAVSTLSFGMAAVTAASAQGQQSTISGRISAQGSNEPIPEARVVLVGTSLFTTSNAEGRYSIRNVPAGTYSVRVIRVGFQEQKKPITVSGGETVTLDFTLDQVVVRLTEVVTTATGEQRKVELGNAVANIDAAKIVETSPVSNVQDVLASRTPGVQVIGGSQTGGGSRVRIRGNSSLNLSNDPIYIIDGIRMTSNANSSSLFTGGSQPNRANDINPDDIESIEIVKGPSAATLYGTDAANGVIVITTKKGRAGAARWNGWAEGGLIDDRSNYPYNYTLASHNPTTGALLITGQCTLPLVAAGTCAKPDSVRKYSPFHDPDATPIALGYRSKFGGSVSGGTEAVRYFVSGEREDETGTQKLPNFERARLDSVGSTISDWTKRPNDQYKYSFRANLNATPSPKFDVGLTSNYIHVNTQFATESNATAGIGSQIYGGKGYPDNGTIGGLGTPLHGYRAWTPGYTYEELVGQRLNRVITSGNANWRPFSWMQNRANVGIDYTSRVDMNLNRRGFGPPVNSTYRLGFADDIRTGIRNFSFDLGSSATWQATQSLSARTTVGAQYVNYQLDQAEAYGEVLAPGTQTANGGATKNSSEATTITKTLGYFVEEQLSYRDRLFVTGAMRTDQNSAFGTKFQRVVYPKASLSYILSDESFFPRPEWLDQFRLRASYGASGVQPGPNDALRTFTSSTVNVKSSDQVGVVYNAVGNLSLRPERTAEFEGGFDARLFGSRTNLEVTYYSKTTKDALIDAIVAPSAGAAQSVKKNLGSVKNAGIEGLITSQIIDRRNLGFDLTVSASANDNKLVSLGDDVPPQINTTWRAVPGYPLFGLWERPINGYQDKNGDGIIVYDPDPAKNEIFVGADPIFRGYSSPRYTATVSPGVDLFNKKLRLSSLIDYKGGYRYYNNTERIRCVSRQNCNGLMNPDASLEEQAMVVATRDDPSRTLDGFFQRGTFWRWREAAVTYTMPEGFVGRYLKARSASVNLAARNISIWTKYRGIDPELDRNAGVSNNAPPEEFQTLGLPSYFTFRLNLGF